jgi:hypothetical protein
MEIPIIKKGRRERIRLFRNVMLVILAMCILFLVCSVAFEFAEGIQYEVFILISMVTLFSSVLTIPLFIKKKIGYLILGEAIHIKTSTDYLPVEKVTIVLNADTVELQDAKNDVTKVRKIRNYGNYLEGVVLPDGQAGELILNKKTKEYLVTWYSSLLKEQFDHRPFMQESPFRIVFGILDIMQAF